MTLVKSDTVMIDFKCLLYYTNCVGPYISHTHQLLSLSKTK